MSAGTGNARDAAQATIAAPHAAAARAGAPLVVFDFDHTLYDGDSGTHLFTWLIVRSPWRMLLALLLAPVFAPMIAFLRTRRVGISAFVWAGTIGLHRRRDLDQLIDAYVAARAARIGTRLLPVALEVMRAHRLAGDQVLIATGAPPRLARAILAGVAAEEVAVIGTLEGPRFGALGAIRHCHAEEKVRMIREAGYTADIARAYSDSLADLPLLQAARHPTVVNPKPGAIGTFRDVLPAGTPILNWGCAGRGGETVSIASH